MAEKLTEEQEKALEEKERAKKAGKAGSYVCITKCYWSGNSTRYNPGDVQDFTGAPPSDFPIQHFERA